MSKSMSNLSDKEIDRLSRDAAEFYEPGESTMSWSKLEQKLAVEMPERPPDGIRFGRISPFIWGAAILIVAGISFYSVKKIAYPESSTPTQQTVKKDKAGADKELTDYSSENNSLHTNDNNPVVPASTEKQGNEQRNRDLKKDHGHVATESATSAGKEKSYLAKQSLIAARTKNQQKTGATRKKGYLALTSVAATTTVAATTNSSDFSTATEVKNGFSNGISKNYQLSMLLPDKSNARLGYVMGNDSMLNHFSKNEVAIPQKIMHINRSLSIGFFFGPDYTAAGGIANNDLGNNIGITIGYYLNKRLSVNSGIFYSNKFFWSKAPPLRPAQNNGLTYAYAPVPSVENINGAASLYEIPLTLRYDFKNIGKSKFFINAGVSSYLIQSQSYIYFYHSPSRSAAWKITDNTPANYWFGVGDFSVGLEQDLGKGFTFQVEPFLRTPFKEMGINNLKMTSYGVLLGFRFSPALGKTKRY